MPVLLIIKQPDYGTAIAFCICTAMILITAGLNKKYIIGAIILAVIALPLLYFIKLNETKNQQLNWVWKAPEISISINYQ